MASPLLRPWARVRLRHPPIYHRLRPTTLDPPRVVPPLQHRTYNIPSDSLRSFKARDSNIDSDPRPINFNTALHSYRLAPQIHSITLNRPRSLNAINASILSLLHSQIKTAVDDKEVRVVVLLGTGDNFCAGQDMKETMTESGVDGEKYKEELADALEKLQDITRMMATSNKFVIAAVQGHAVGGGAELALAADYVLASRTAKFSFPEVKIGAMATGGVTGRLMKIVGLMRAKELLFTGRVVEAEEAYRIGLVSEVVDTFETVALQNKAAEFARIMARRSVGAVAGTKRRVEETAQKNLGLEEVLKREVEDAVGVMAGEEARKAYRSFIANQTSTSPLSGGSGPSIRFTNQAGAHPGTQQKRGFFKRVLAEIRKLAQSDGELQKFNALEVEEKREYILYAVEQYEKAQLKRLDEVYQAYGANIKQSWVDFEAMLTRQIKMDFYVQNNPKKREKFARELRDMTVKTVERHKEVDGLRQAIRQQDWYPPGVDSEVMDDLDKFVEGWNEVWRLRWEYQKEKNRVGLETVELRCYGDKFLEFMEGSCRVEEWREATRKATRSVTAGNKGKDKAPAKLRDLASLGGHAPVKMFDTTRSAIADLAGQPVLKIASGGEWNSLNHLLAGSVVNRGTAATPLLRCGGWTETNIADFYEQSRRMAFALARHAKVKPGDRVMVFMRPSPLSVLTWFATNRVGAAWCPLDPEVDDDIVRRAVEEMKPKIVIMESKFKNRLNKLVPDPDVEFWADDSLLKQEVTFVDVKDNATESEKIKEYEPEPFEDCQLDDLKVYDVDSLTPYRPDPDDTSAIFYDYYFGDLFGENQCTHRFFLEQAKKFGKDVKLTKEDVVYTSSPISSQELTAIVLVPALMYGCVAAVSQKYNFDDVAARGATIVNAPGEKELAEMNQAILTEKKLRNVRFTWTMPSAPDASRRFKEKYGQDVKEMEFA